MTLGLSSAEDCMSEWYNLRCKPKAEAGKYGQHPALFQDGDPCFTLAPYGTICYVGTKTQKFDYCSVSSPGCYDFGCRFSNQTRVDPFKKSCLELPESTFSRCGRSSWTFWAQLEVCSFNLHLPPSLQSFGLVVLEANFWGRQIDSKLKIYYANRYLGVQK